MQLTKWAGMVPYLLLLKCSMGCAKRSLISGFKSFQIELDNLCLITKLKLLHHLALLGAPVPIYPTLVGAFWLEIFLNGTIFLF